MDLTEEVADISVSAGFFFLLTDIGKLRQRGLRNCSFHSSIRKPLQIGNSYKAGSPVIGPGSAIGLLGGGQLRRMMAQARANLGYRFVALDPTPDSPCGQVARQIVAGYGDKEAARQLAQQADVITYEFENVDAEVAALLEELSLVPQGSKLLYKTQHRLREKQAIEAAGVKVAPYARIGSEQELKEALERAASVGGQEHGPIGSRYFSGFFCFIGTSSCPESRTRTCTDCRKGQEHNPITD